MIATLILVLALIPMPAPHPTSVRHNGYSAEQAMTWAERLMSRGYIPSPDIWGHRFCLQLQGPETTVYRCADGHRDYS